MPGALGVGTEGRGRCGVRQRLVAGGLKTHEAPPHPVSWRKIRRSGMTAAAVAAAGRRRRRSRESGGRREGGGEGLLLEWKNTISPALLQCLSSQLVTL